jgi:hypothetical protein
LSSSTNDCHPKHGSSAGNAGARLSPCPRRQAYVVEPSSGREISAGDFFHLEEVGTHPTGLFVTGIFDNARRNHMLASAVRDASPDEIARHESAGF